MSLLLATLLPGLALLTIGGLLIANNSLVTSSLRTFPRSRPAAALLFGSGAIWFLINVWNLSPADFGAYSKQLTIAFAAIALLSWFYVPEFLAVRGLAILMLLAAGPLLHAAYQEYEHPARLFMVTLVYASILLAIWLAAQPYRLRDFINWLYRTPSRPKTIGAACLGYGALLTVIAFTY